MITHESNLFISRHRRMSHFASFFLVLILAALPFLALTGCSSDEGDAAAQDASEQSQTSDDAVAATSGDIVITEAQVADFVKRYRTYAGVEGDAEFATLLDETGTTPDAFREQVIEQLVTDELVRMKATEEGISVNDSEIDTYIDDIKAGLGYASGSKEWKRSLDIAGYSEEQYRYDVETKLLVEKLVANDVPMRTVSESEMLALANENISDYVGANIVSVTFPRGNGAKASAFAKAMKGKSEKKFISAASKEVGSGDATEITYDGWTCINEPDSAVLLAVSEKMPGGVGMAQQNDGTYKVFYVKEVFMPNSNGAVTYSAIPAQIREKLRSDASREAESALAAEYLDGLYSSAEVNITEMPDDAGYNVDMSLSTYGAKEDESYTDEEMESMAADHVSNMESADNGVNIAEMENLIASVNSSK